MTTKLPDQIYQVRRKLIAQIKEFFPTPEYTRTEQDALLRYAIDGTPVSVELSARMAASSHCMDFYEVMQTVEELLRLQEPALG